MAKKPQPEPAPHRSLASSLLASRSLWGVVVVLGAFIVGASLMWERVRNLVLARQDYKIELQDIKLPPQPAWIRTEINTLKQEALRDAHLDPPLSLLDKTIGQRVAKAFRLHPWIAAVEKVDVSYTDKIVVDLTYREPVLAVEAAVLPTEVQVFPIDIKGVQLPTADFDKLSIKQYPHLAGSYGTPTTLVGQVWNQKEILEAAKIGAALVKLWPNSPLANIRWNNNGTPENALDRHYVLETKTGKQLIWGSPPGAEIAGEPSAAEKAKLLAAWIARTGGIDGLIAKKPIDLRYKKTWPE